MPKFVVRLIGDGDEHRYGDYLKVLVEYMLIKDRGVQETLFPEDINVVEETVRFLGTRSGVDNTPYTYTVDHVSDKVQSLLSSLGIKINDANKLSLMRAVESTFGETTLLRSLLKKNQQNQLVVTTNDNGLCEIRKKGFKVLQIGIGEKSTLEETIEHLYKQIKIHNF